MYVLNHHYSIQLLIFFSKESLFWVFLKHLDFLLIIGINTVHVFFVNNHTAGFFCLFKDNLIGKLHLLCNLKCRKLYFLLSHRGLSTSFADYELFKIHWYYLNNRNRRLQVQNVKCIWVYLEQPHKLLMTDGEKGRKRKKSSPSQQAT